MTNIENTLLNHVHYLCAEIGPRPLGSPANQQAANYITVHFRRFGLDVEEQPYRCTAWEQTSTLLERDGVQLEAEANPFSLSCDVSAPIVPIGTLSELESSTAAGRIFLFYGDLARTPLSPKSWFLLDDRDRRVIELLEQHHPEALLAPPTATDYYGHLTEDAELDLPAATISPWTALRLVKEPHVPVHMKIDAHRIPSTASNVIGRRPGKGSGKISLMAHFDTKINTPGALDNAGGVSILLALAESLQADCTLEFVAFNGEEYLPMGDDEYLRHSEADFPYILMAVNFDGAGAVLGSNSVTAVSGSPEFVVGIRSTAESFPGVVWVEPWPESNHSTFAFRGVPAIAFSSVGTRGLSHSRLDCLEQVSAAKLIEICHLAAKIVEEIHIRPVGWGR